MMKKLLLPVVATFFAVPVLGQFDLRETRIGVTAGGHFSRISNAHKPSGPRYTFEAGVTALIPLGYNDVLYLQPELTYYGAGETGRDKDRRTTTKDLQTWGYNAKYINDYVSLPIYLKGYFSSNETEFFGMLGPRFNYLIREQVTNAPTTPDKRFYVPGNPVEDPKNGNFLISGEARKYDIAIAMGLGFSYKRKLEVSLRWDVGMFDKYPNLKYTDDGADSFKKKSEQVISLNLNYIIN